MNDTTLTARDFVRRFERLALGRYVVTRYGKPWRVVIVEEVGAADVAAGPEPVAAVAGSPVAGPGPVVGPVGPVDVSPAVRPEPVEVEPAAPVVAGWPLGANPAMARFLARSDPAPAPVSAVEVKDKGEGEVEETMTKVRWSRLSPDAQRRRVAQLGLDQEAFYEWLEGLPAR
jgi:hypothetical protein